MKKYYLFFAFLFVAFSVFPQTQPLDNVVIAVAPHVPVMQIYSGIGSKFTGVKFIYKNDENLASLKKWIADYPDEVIGYKRVMKKMIANTHLSILSKAELEMFDGFQAQFKMLQQILK